MSDVPHDIDYELLPEAPADAPEQMKALGDPLRLLLVDLVLERAMTVSELAERVDRPRGTVAYHVDVLVEAGLLRVVRTRKVRAVEERFYGRVARTFKLGHPPGRLPFVDEAETQFAPQPDLPAAATLRHARIPADRVDEYIERLHELALEFTAEARDGDVEYALMFQVFPTNRLPAGRRSPEPDE